MPSAAHGNIDSLIMTGLWRAWPRSLEAVQERFFPWIDVN